MANTNNYMNEMLELASFYKRNFPAQTEVEIQLSEEEFLVHLQKIEEATNGSFEGVHFNPLEQKLNASYMSIRVLGVTFHFITGSIVGLLDFLLTKASEGTGAGIPSSLEIVKDERTVTARLTMGNNIQVDTYEFEEGISQSKMVESLAIKALRKITDDAARFRNQFTTNDSTTKD